MKKLICVASALIFALSASAQLYPKNIISVRGGLNVSSMSQKVDGKQVSKDFRKPKIGWHVGAVDEVLLSSNMPLYIDLGLMLSNKGVRYVENSTVTVLGNEASVKTVYQYGVTYLQIPVSVSYHLYAGDFTFQPYAGLHYDVGLWGRYVNREKVRSDVDKSANKTTKDVQNVYKNGIFKRSDFGVVLGVGMTYLERYYFGVSWEDGFCDISKMSGVRFSNLSNFRISCGYNF